jgi:hypothetical protein
MVNPAGPGTAWKAARARKCLRFEYVAIRLPVGSEGALALNLRAPGEFPRRVRWLLASAGRHSWLGSIPRLSAC